MKNLKITFNAPAVLILVALSFVATLLSYITGGFTTQLIFMTYHSALTDPLTYVRFFTHVFGHSGWSHFMSNAAYLLLLGPVLEEKYGTGKMVAVIMVTGFVTGVFNYIVFPGIAVCGASGVVFAFIVLVGFTGFKNREIPITLILIVLIFIGEQVYDGIFLQDNISNASHILGGAVGAVLGYVWSGK